MRRGQYVMLWLCLAAVFAWLPASAATNPAALSGTIDWLVWGNATSDAIDQAVIAAFEAKYPKVKVNMIKSTGSHNDKLLTMIAAGTPPDIAIIDSYDFADHVHKGTIMDVTDWAKRDGITGKDIVPAYWEEMKMNGRLYSVANVRTGTLIMIYNQEHINEVGLTSPSIGKGWNWDELMSAAKRLTRDLNNDGVVDRHAIDPSDFALWPWVWMAGGEIFNKDQTSTVLNEPRAMRGLQFFADLYLNGYASNGDILDGKRTIKIAWPTSLVSTYREQAKFEWDIAPLPAGPVDQITAAKGNPVIIPASAKNKELAWEFMKFLGSEEAQYIYGSRGRFFPNHRRAGQRLVQESRASNLPPAHLLLLISDMKARPLPLVPGFREVNNFMRDTMRPALRGQRSVQEAATIIDERSKVMLAEAKQR